jgi:YD repeat-containing protein
MKQILTIFLTILVLTSCLNKAKEKSGQKQIDLINFYRTQLNSIDSISTGNKIMKEKLIYSYCQQNLTKPFSKQVLSYDSKNRLTKTTVYMNNIIQYWMKSNYNNIGLLTSQEFYYPSPNNKLNWTRIFKYNKNNKLIYEGYDGKSGSNSRNTYSYNNIGQLIASTDECNYTHWVYSYEYDSLGQLCKKFKNGTLQFSYEYSKNKLAKEIQYKSSRNVVTKYAYDKTGLLLDKWENDKLTEKNIYYKGYLIRKWTYYFGIDPCYDPCCGKYVLIYKYL